MTFIVDASVAVKWFVRENLHEEALAVLEENAGELEAPGFLMTEVANIAWKKAVRGEISQQHAQAIPVEMRECFTAFHPSPDLAGRALEIALQLNHPVYDCQYLACAEAVDGILVTADRKFCEIVRSANVSGQIRFLGEPGSTLLS